MYQTENGTYIRTWTKQNHILMFVPHRCIVVETILYSRIHLEGKCDKRNCLAFITSTTLKRTTENETQIVLHSPRSYHFVPAIFSCGNSQVKCCLIFIYSIFEFENVRPSKYCAVPANGVRFKINGTSQLNTTPQYYAGAKLENYVETVKSITGGLRSYDPSPNRRRRFICFGFDLLILRLAFKIEYINFEKFVVD